ncbi:MAG: FAD-dependent oxidoreductase [Clostridiales bacterium]|nr:FAD-dependent oxidoreductase [Clostridiales bacterium]
MMSTVLVVGGGLAGAATAKELAASGVRVLMAEATGALGGKVCDYGCKAASKCSNCGVCLTKGLWSEIEESDLVDVRLETRLVDLRGDRGAYTAALKSGGKVDYVEGISDVVVATGFKNESFEDAHAFVEVAGACEDGGSSIIMGSDIERIFKGRDAAEIFEKTPERIAFIQCFGSRDKANHAMYCSRVCCAYSSRAAKVIRQYHPACDIVFFYMEMQQVQSGDYFDELKALGVKFIKCRPVKVTAGEPACVVFDNPETGRRESLSFDLVVLSNGIQSADDAAGIAEVCGLGQDAAGFLKYVTDVDDAKRTGVYIVGCAGGPAKIEDVYAEAVAVARCIA